MLWLSSCLSVRLTAEKHAVRTTAKDLQTTNETDGTQHTHWVELCVSLSLQALKNMLYGCSTHEPLLELSLSNSFYSSCVLTAVCGLITN